MSRPIRRLFADDSGAVTVDWVVLIALAAAFGVVVITTLGAGTDDMAYNIQTSFEGMHVAPLQTLGYSE